jgi:hypothetical protein
VTLFFEFIKGYGAYMKQLDKAKDRTTQVNGLLEEAIEWLLKKYKKKGKK